MSEKEETYGDFELIKKRGACLFLSDYPTPKEVCSARREDLVKWLFDLAAPGISAAGLRNFYTILNYERSIMWLIIRRLTRLDSTAKKAFREIQKYKQY